MLRKNLTYCFQDARKSPNHIMALRGYREGNDRKEIKG
jgi:hypothetical protein